MARTMWKRFLSYACAAIVFGVLNWVFREQLSNIVVRFVDPRGISRAIEDPLLHNLFLGVPLFLIWALAALVVIVIEIRSNPRPLMSGIAVTWFWLIANVAYYAIYAIYAGEILLGRGLGGPQVPFATDPGWSTFWDSLSRLDTIVGTEFRLYAAIAIIAGPIASGVGGYIMLRMLEWQSNRRAAHHAGLRREAPHHP